jgi:hypothetical protein
MNLPPAKKMRSHRNVINGGKKYNFGYGQTPYLLRKKGRSKTINFGSGSPELISLVTKEVNSST